MYYIKECILEEKECIYCGKCDLCDLDDTKICDNCGKCINNDSDFRSIEVEDILEIEE